LTDRFPWRWRNHRPSLEIDARDQTRSGAFDPWKGTRIMTLLKWALIILVVSIIAGIFGFTGISAASADIARILFYLFVAIFLVLLILGLTLFRA
jgi:uncharacterized membrane protein YtjA (UPF0391 family)